MSALNNPDSHQIPALERDQLTTRSSPLSFCLTELGQRIIAFGLSAHKNLQTRHNTPCIYPLVSGLSHALDHSSATQFSLFVAYYPTATRFALVKHSVIDAARRIHPLWAARYLRGRVDYTCYCCIAMGVIAFRCSPICTAALILRTSCILISYISIPSLMWMALGRRG